MRRAIGYLARRIAWAALLVLGVGTLTFFIMRALPGDPARLIVGPQASAADAAATRRSYGLDRPIAVQYARFWRHMVHAAGAAGDHASCYPIGRWHLDLGMSASRGAPVALLIRERAPRSIELGAAAMLLQLVIGLSVAAFAARRRGEFSDQAAMAAVMLAVSAPAFVIGLGLQYLFAHRLGWLPIDSASGDRRALVLPASTLGLYGAALYARLGREELGQALSADCIRAVRARGGSELRALGHALRLGALPIVTVAVLDLGALIGGAIVTERVFRWPGLGSLAVDAVMNRDAPVLFGTVLVSAAAIALATLALDALGYWLDPRLRR